MPISPKDSPLRLVLEREASCWAHYVGGQGQNLDLGKPAVTSDRSNSTRGSWHPGQANTAEASAFHVATFLATVTNCTLTLSRLIVTPRMGGI